MMLNDEEKMLLERQRMVREQLLTRGINDSNLLKAMEAVPRHRFVPTSLTSFAYQDGPLPIGEGQTISQPYIVALMIQAAEINASSKVLEIGTGSGYSAAVLAKLAKEVHSIERLPDLAKNAESLLNSLEYNNVSIHTGDGTLGLPEKAPFDAILVTAGAPAIPENLLKQLEIGGRVIIPVGDSQSQELRRLRKKANDQYEQEVIELVRFVPLIGKQGW